MRDVKPPRDWVSRAGGAGVALLLLAGLGYAVAGPAARLVAKPLAEVWVTIIRPSPGDPRPKQSAPAALPAPRPH